MKTELETLRAELHKEVDAKIDKLIKPEFEVGDYVEWMGCHRTKGRIVKRYGDNYHLSLDFSNTPSESHDSCNYRNLRKLTPTEVQEALKKEAVKRGFKYKAKVINIFGKKDKVGSSYFMKDNKFYTYGFSEIALLMDENGTWATPIKTMTIDELGLDYENWRCKKERAGFNEPKDFSDYLTENKTQIIETLNNL